MARIRTIKPEFFTSEDIVSLSPLARLLYIATWCDADKEGRLLWKPRTFKLRYFPGDDCDMQALCDELVKSGLIVLYGDGLAYIPSFSKHQHINPRESKSTLPDPESNASSRVTTRQHASTLEMTRREEGKGREGKGKEGDTEPYGSDGQAVPDTRSELWKAGKSLLSEQGMPIAQCGTFVGRLVKEHGEDVVVDAVRAAVVQRPADAASFLVGACRGRGRKGSRRDGDLASESARTTAEAERLLGIADEVIDA